MYGDTFTFAKIHALCNIFTVIALVLGSVLGYCVPQASFLSIFGTMFVGALKAIAPVLVFLLVLSSLMSSGGGIGKRISTVVTLYLTLSIFP